ncbi:HAMP domain-containing sensor histidine kinase [Brevibacillus sp. AY1]|uniref:HAMP domain-containing sensor histidine kinase n=1 Tax=Brevibacillus sp. AY1 TaxID=2807621 RepID=UPI002455B1FA|nr:HAMP domain-containing sensor histidine kinase [Brevibacillus sp. AY1]MDH4619019.1 HAMP domain-containing histidine kinase [Brevibacillus sp. AY1]
MYLQSNKPISLLRYWTTRYLLTLCVGLLIIGIVSSIWIKDAATEKQLDVTRLFAEEVADRVVDDEGKLYVGETLHQILESRRRFMGVDRNLLLFIKDEHDQIIYKKSGLPSSFEEDLDRVLEIAEKADKVKSRHGDTLFVVKKDLENDLQKLGTIILLFPETDIRVNKEQLQYLVIMLGSLGVLGWAVIYFHSKKLSRPIEDVVEAAKQIVEGNYDVTITKNIKEREIHELVHTFKEMADRLRQLERTRTELLAGVTHELKTPVTSISGLIQAINDKVVSGDEEREFLEICLNETKRLEKMVEDLLDFNSFAVGEITVQPEAQNLNKLIHEIASQWQIGQDVETITLTTRMPDQEWTILVDPGRVQQILINLLNNARQAVTDDGVIELHLYEKESELRIDVTDNGKGIREEEQSLVFERFFRGSNKKEKVRGLGLGLSFSKMMARALGGDLILTKSDANGSTFTLILPKISG